MPVVVLLVVVVVVVAVVVAVVIVVPYQPSGALNFTKFLRAVGL